MTRLDWEKVEAERQRYEIATATKRIFKIVKRKLLGRLNAYSPNDVANRRFSDRSGRGKSIKFLQHLGLALLLVACEGPTGPAGPPGSIGLPGPEGPPGASRVVIPGTLNAQGSATVTLPLEAGSGSDLPVIGCYVSMDGQPPWLVISDGITLTGAYCIVSVPAPSGALRVGIRQSLPGFAFAIVAVF